MIWELNTNYYYFIFYNAEKEFGLAKVEVIGRPLSTYFPLLKILKIYTPDVWLGHKDRIAENGTVTANEFQGVGASGPDGFFFTEKSLIEAIFEKDNYKSD
jgi:hypothetical protein